MGCDALAFGSWQGLHVVTVAMVPYKVASHPTRVATGCRHSLTTEVAVAPGRFLAIGVSLGALGTEKREKRHCGLSFAWPRGQSLTDN